METSKENNRKVKKFHLAVAGIKAYKSYWSTKAIVINDVVALTI